LGFYENAWFYAGVAECSAQFQSFTQLVVRAADMMQRPRIHGTAVLDCENVFVHTLASAVEADVSGVPHLQQRGLDARVVQLLTGAWQRLKRSGVLDARGVLDERARLELSTYNGEHTAAVLAAMAAPGLRSCALAGCGAKEAHPQHFKSCSACRTVVYCCREHQVEGWPAHKKACKAARKAVSDGGAGPGSAS